MFREMRRNRQQLSAAETEQILVNGKMGTLAVCGDDGYPYTVPLNYVYTGGKIYFHTAKQGHKIDAIRACDKVSFCVVEKSDIVPEELTTYFRSVIVFGCARVLEDRAEIVSVMRTLGLKFYDDLPAVEAEIEKVISSVACVEITIGHATGKEAIELTRMRGGK